ncbi:MAG: hypothetical protein IJ667_09360, partial [Synergistaceae bacterium]|nr:hypothetical protein [Synergistaceae bacterium]
ILKMKKLLLKILIVNLCVMFYAGYALADVDIRVDDAVSSCPDSAIYAAFKLENVNGLVNWIFGDENLNLFAPVLDFNSEDIGMIKAIASRVGCRALMFVAGLDAQGRSFVKAAFDFNENYKDILSKIERGDAEPDDLKKLLIGDNSPLDAIADGIIKAEHDENKNLLRVNNNIWMSARENLLLLGSSPEIVKAGIAAIDNKLFRLNLNRRYNSQNFIYAHLNTETILRYINRHGRTRRMFKAQNLRLFKSMFKAPLNFELDFDLQEDNFKLSAFMNLREALSEKFYNTFCVNEPVTGGNLDLNINSTPFIAFGSSLNLNALRDIKELHSLVKNLLNNNDIDEELLFDLVNGKFAFNFGGAYVSMGLFKLPAIYLAKTCEDIKAAEAFMDIIPKDNVNKVKAEGWGMLLKAPVTVSPLPLYLGNLDNTLYLGMFEPDLINKIKLDKELEAEFNDLVNKKALAALYINFEALRKYLQRETSGALSFLAAMAGKKNELAKIKNFLEAELSVPLVTASVLNHGEIEINFKLKEINFKNGLWSKIFNVIK